MFWQFLDTTRGCAFFPPGLCVFRGLEERAGRLIMIHAPS